MPCREPEHRERRELERHASRGGTQRWGTVVDGAGGDAHNPFWKSVMETLAIGRHEPCCGPSQRQGAAPGRARI